MRLLFSAAVLLVFQHTSSAVPHRHRARVVRMQATAFVQSARPTAAGTVAHQGVVAADPAVLPLGSRIRISRAGAYSGLYTVTDTGGHIKGRRIDVVVASAAEARKFGRRMVTVQLLETGEGAEDARQKDIPAARKRR